MVKNLYGVCVGGIILVLHKETHKQNKSNSSRYFFFLLAERVPRTQTEHTPQTGLCLLIPDICGIGASVHWWVLSFTADVLG